MVATGDTIARSNGFCSRDRKHGSGTWLGEPGVVTISYQAFVIEPLWSHFHLLSFKVVDNKPSQEPPGPDAVAESLQEVLKQSSSAGQDLQNVGNRKQQKAVFPGVWCFHVSLAAQSPESNDYPSDLRLI